MSTNAPELSILSSDVFDHPATELVRRGYPRTVAERYLSLVGDTPELAEDGRWIVRGDRGGIIDIIAPIKRSSAVALIR
jgi:hypothetical protein